MSVENGPSLEKGNDDLTTEQGVVNLMLSSKDRDEWNANCDKVKAANNRDYPSFWRVTINESGVYAKTKENWREK